MKAKSRSLLTNMQKQKGAIPLIVMAVVFALLALGGGTVYYFGRANKLKEEIKTGEKVQTGESATQQTQATEIPLQGERSLRSSTPTTTDELSDWQEYLNDRYHYKVKYPKDWYFIKEGYSPPPPTTVVFSSIKDPYPSASAEHMSIEISVDQSLGRTLDNYEEIASLKSQYYQETKLTIGGEPAAKIAVPDPNSSEPISVYIQHKDYIYRIVWGDSTDEFVQNRKLLDKILQTFTFTD